MGDMRPYIGIGFLFVNCSVSTLSDKIFQKTDFKQESLVLMALNPPFQPLASSEAYLFYPPKRRGDFQPLKMLLCQPKKRIWKCWQMVVSPDVSRRCWLESVSSVSLQNIFPAKIQLFQVRPSYNWHWFYCKGVFWNKFCTNESTQIYNRSCDL